MKSTQSFTSAGRRCLASIALLAIGTIQFIACGSSTGGESFQGAAPSSKTAPQPGSIVGNWVLESIQVLKDTGELHRLRAGMNLRISETAVEVLMEEYIGPGSILPTVMANFFGTELDLTQSQDNATGFDLQMILDFGPIFNMPKGSFLTKVTVAAKLVQDTLKVAFLQQEMLDLGKGLKETGRDELQLTFQSGTTVQELQGTWRVSETSIFVIVDTSPLEEILLRIPIPRRVKDGDFLVNGRDRVLGLFGGPFDVDDFKKAFPEFNTRLHLSSVDNGAVQGFLAFDGKARSKSAKMSGVGDFNFFHTGKVLQGDLRMVWFDDNQTHAYHVYLTLSKVVSQNSQLRGQGQAAQQAQLTATEHESPFLPQPARLYERLFFAQTRIK